MTQGRIFAESLWYAIRQPSPQLAGVVKSGPKMLTGPWFSRTSTVDVLSQDCRHNLCDRKSDDLEIMLELVYLNE